MGRGEYRVVTEINDGGQAYPAAAEFYEEINYSHEKGLTKREYYAAYAPEMPEWFITKTYKGPKSFSEGSAEHTEYDRVVAECFFKWRWYYAERMVKNGK